MTCPSPRLTLGVTAESDIEGGHLLCPRGELQWGRWDIQWNPPRGSRCDYWIVYAASRDRDRLLCAPENTLFIAGEPPSKKIYPKAFYGQFYRVVSTRAEDPHPRVTASAPGLSWHVGLDREKKEYRYGYDYLSALRPTAKLNQVSVVCSNLTTTEGQRRRLALLAHLKEALGDQLVHFGRGFTPITDKLDAIAPYRYHLVLENSCSPHYWTEKLCDAYLGWAHPVYLGCPNLTDYFPATGFTPIQTEYPEKAVETLRALLASPPQDPTSGVLAECRDMILNRYNFFARLSGWADAFHVPTSTPTELHITTHKAYRSFPRGLLYRLRSAPRRSSPL